MHSSCWRWGGDREGQRGPVKPWMLPARAANSLLLLTQDIPCGMGMVIWTCRSRGCGQEETDPFLGASQAWLLHFQPHLPPAFPRPLRPPWWDNWEILGASPSPLPPSSPPPASPGLSGSLWAEHFVCKVLSDATLRGAVNQRAGPLQKPRQMKTFYHNLDLFALV